VSANFQGLDQVTARSNRVCGGQLIGQETISVTLVFTTLPAHGVGRVGGLTVAFPGALAALALGAGIAVQPLGRRLVSAPVTRGGTAAGATGLGLVTAGCAAAAVATAHPGVVPAIAAATLLGAGYGLCMLWGLREVEQLAPPGELGGLVALFYSLAYSGLAFPYLLALAAPHLGYPLALLLTGLGAALTMLVVRVQGRRHPVIAC